MIKTANTFSYNSSVLVNFQKLYHFSFCTQFKVIEDMPAIYSQELKVLLGIILLTLVLITLERLMTLSRNK